MIRTYNEMILLPSFKERFDYLKLDGKVGKDTFGYDRYANQIFYKSPEWISVRNKVILRDMGMDLGVEGMPIHGRVLIHHLNPITIEDIVNRSESLFSLNNLICVSFDTHQAIHYGDFSLIDKTPVIRTINDTCPWRI